VNPCIRFKTMPQLLPFLLSGGNPIAVFALSACVGVGLAACNSERAGERVLDAGVDVVGTLDADAAPDTADDADLGVADVADDIAADSGDSSDDTDAAGEDADANDGAEEVADVDPLPDCETVCIEFVGVPESAAGDGIARIESDECNSVGLDPGTCPGGLACVDVAPRWQTVNLFYDTPVCALDADTDFVFEVGPAPDAVPVDVTLTLNGGEWPARAADLTVFVTPREEGRVFERLLLSDQDTLSLMLPRGVYDLDFSKPPGASDPLPVIVERARLIVSEPGRATLDVEASPVDLVLELDGAPLDEVRNTPDGQIRVIGRLTRPDGFLWAFTAQPTDTIGSITVQHGTYEFEVYLTTTGSFSFRGRLGGSRTIDVSGPGERLRVAGETARLGGQFSSSGEGTLGETRLQLATSVVQQQYLVGDDGAVSAETLNAEYVARLASTSNLDPELFSGAITLGSVTPPATLDETFAFARGTFRVFVNDERLESSSSARLELVTPNGSVSTLPFDGTGLATGTVLAAPAEVYVIGDGRAVPGGTMRALDWDPTALPTRLDVRGAEIEFSIALDGEIDWPQRTEGSTTVRFTQLSVDEGDRPRLLFNAFTPRGRTDSVTLSLPGHQDAVLRPLLLRGRWQAEALVQTEDGDYVKTSDPFDVPGEPVTIEIDRRSITVTLEQGGQPLRDGSRGEILFDGGAVSLPTSGPATVTLPDVHRETGLIWSCRAELICSDPMWLGRTPLVSGLLP
jgi:hypothetical protein